MSVKLFLSFLFFPLLFSFPELFAFSRAASVAILPSALFRERCSLGAVGCTRFSRCCYLIFDLCSLFSKRTGPGVGRSHLISAVELGCLDTSLLGPVRQFPQALVSFFFCYFFLRTFPRFSWRNFGPGSPRNDDRQLRRPIASAVLSLLPSASSNRQRILLRAPQASAPISAAVESLGRLFGLDSKFLPTS